MSASEDRPARLCDFPVVFLSYDEPWADRNWQDLTRHFQRAVRVHGVKGLDACHKAAAAAVPGDWVVTVDADTRVAAALADAAVPEHLLTGNFRMDWLARNVVNGLWSGNGCVKLWPKALIAEMRTHEAAPPEILSLDHDVAAIRNGRSVQVPMPERLAATDPAETAFHAFRAGLRETVFLRTLAEAAATRRGEGSWQAETELLRLIEVWCSVGRQALNGHWMLYGARLGLVLADLWPDWDPRTVNDHDALRRLWAERVAPDFQLGAPRRADETAWNWPALEAALSGLAREIAARGGPVLAELDARKSAVLAGTARLASPIRAARLDALGYWLTTGSRGAETRAAARNLLEQAALLDHPAAHFNLSRIEEAQPGPDPSRRAFHLGAAAALGNPAAQERIAALAAAGQDLRPVQVARDLPGADGTAPPPDGTDVCLVLDPGVTLAPLAARHVPDPSLVEEGAVLGYLAQCPVSGLPRPTGVRLARADRAHAPPDAILPLVLGQLPPPADADAALRDGAADALAGRPEFLATLGRDAEFGDLWVLAALRARLGRGLTDRERAKWAAASPEAVADAMSRLAGDLAQSRDVEVPVWSAAESRAVKRMLPALPAREAWLAAAKGLSGLGPFGQARAEVLRAAATTLWGAGPDAP